MHLFPDTRLYKKLERPIEELKRSAYAGRKNVVRWSHFVEDMHELMTVANHLAQNSSLTISPYEQLIYLFSPSNNHILP